MGLGMMGLAILIFILVFGMLYISFRNQADKKEQNVFAGDSVTLIDYTQTEEVNKWKVKNEKWKIGCPEVSEKWKMPSG